MNTGILCALAAAVLFGASTPLAKMAVGAMSPWLLAGLLYLGSGIGLALAGPLLPGRRVRLAGREWRWLAGAIACGGIVGPLLLMQGLATTTAGTASLLLNAEAVFTALLAWIAFGENIGRRIALGMAAIVAGAVVLSWSADARPADIRGNLAILGACLCWALDNNLTRKVSLSDPLRIATLKGLVAGAVNTGLALAIHPALPSLPALAFVGAVGFLGYGVSLVLFVVGLRHLGTARAGAYFSAAPFVGAVAATAFLHEPVTARLLAAAALMGTGVWLHLTEHHEHEHRHDAVGHDHVHRHDEHHDHRHQSEVAAEHSHWHQHAPLRHRHPHYPDAHHRHPH